MPSNADQFGPMPTTLKSFSEPRWQYGREFKEGCVEHCGPVAFKDLSRKGFMISAEQNVGLARALQETFGVSECEDISRMTKGLSSDLAFRIMVKGSPFLLRIMTRMDERNDPVRVFACMKTAADAGLAPRVLYSNTEAGIAIIDFIEAVPFRQRRHWLFFLQRCKGSIDCHHFPTAFNYVTAHKGFIWRFRAAGLLPDDQIEEVFRRYDQICAVYPRIDADLVSCHMDLKPENILFDGRGTWLIDWMAASVNDRYFDLAIVANFVITSDANELTYLERYFGQRPDEYQRADFSLCVRYCTCSPQRFFCCFKIVMCGKKQ